MDLERFKRLHSKFSKLPISAETMQSDDYLDYIDAFHEDEACKNHYLEMKLQKAKFPYKKFCCLSMAYHLAFPGDQNDVDQIMDFDEKHKEYGIPIHDGGSSVIHIKFCPWCGTKL
jgi:hypothetical protein